MLAKKPKGATKKRKSNSASGLLWMFVGAVLTLMIGVFLYLSPLFNFTPSPNAAASDPNRKVAPRVNTDTDNIDYEFYDILPSHEMATIPDESINALGSNQISNNNFEPDVVITQPENGAINNATTNNMDIPEGKVIEQSRDNNIVGSSDEDIVIVEENATYDGTTPTNSNETSGNNSANNSAAPNRANNAAATTANIEKAKSATTYILQINSFGNADEADQRRAQVLMAGVDAKVVKNTASNGAPIYQVISRSMNNRQAVAMAQQRLQNNGIDSIIVEQRR